MQTKSFILPVVGGDQVEAEMNEWLSRNDVVSKQAELREIGGALYWVVLFFSMSNDLRANVGARPADGAVGVKRGFGKRKDVDYRETLSLDDFAVYSMLRDVRNEIQQREGCPAYVICTNAQLAEMVLSRCATLDDLKRIKGFGDARVQKYGKSFLDALKSGFESRKISQEDSNDASSSPADPSEPSQDSTSNSTEPPFDLASKVEKSVPGQELTQLTNEDKSNSNA